jgi:hypothetical protein
LLRKLLDRERFVFYPMAKGKARWYDLGVTPTLERFFGAVPMLKKAVASPSTPSWNQIAPFLEAMRKLREASEFAA